MRGHICILLSRIVLTTTTYLFSSQEHFPPEMFLFKPHFIYVQTNFLSRSSRLSPPALFRTCIVLLCLARILAYSSLLHLLGRSLNIFWKLFCVQTLSKENNAESLGYVTLP